MGGSQRTAEPGACWRWTTNVWPENPLSSMVTNDTSSRPRNQEDQARNKFRGNTAERVPRNAKTEQNVKKLARRTQMAWVRANWRYTATGASAEAVTNSGNRTTEAALMSTTKIVTAMAMAQALASRIRRGRMGRGARFR